MKLVLPLLTCYAIVDGFYVTQENRDVKKLTDLLLSYMANGKVPHNVILSGKIISFNHRMFISSHEPKAHKVSY